MTDVTQILSQIESGDPSAAEQLLPLVYEELRKLAAAKLAQEKPGQTLQATSLVHEAYVRLVDVEKAQHWNSRGHFFGAAAEAMRRILVENARQASTRLNTAAIGFARRWRHLELPPRKSRKTCSRSMKLLSDWLNTIRQAAELVKLRYFAGLTIPQVAELLGVSPRKADFMWSFARAWLRREMEGR